MKWTACFAWIALASGASAQTEVVGKWTGKVVLSKPAFPAGTSAKEKQLVEDQMAKVKKTAFTLNVKPNKTFVIGMSAGIRPEPHDTSGVWSYAKRSLTLTPANPSGVANSDKPMVLTLSSDGKKLTSVLKQKLGTATFVFVRP